MFNNLDEARKVLGDEKVLHHVNAFMKDYARRKEYNKVYNKKQREDLKEYRTWRAGRENFRDDFAKLREETKIS